MSKRPEIDEGTIFVTVTTIDHLHKRRRFQTLKGARKFAQHYIGAHPEISVSFNYAVSDDGVAKVTCYGAATLRDLFPPPVSQPPSVTDWEIEY